MIKTILIQGAMKKEIEVFLKNMQNIEDKIINGYNYYIGNIGDKNIIISETKIGVINATLATFIGLNTFKPDLLINQGCSGGYGKMNKGDIAIATDIININSYECENELILKTFRADSDGGDIEGELISSDVEYAQNLYKYISKNYDKNVVKGVLGSGDCWNKNIDKINYIHKRYNVLCEDMESIATFKVCRDNNVKVLGVRIISNNEVLGSKYDSSVVYTLQELILEYIKQI